MGHLSQLLINRLQQRQLSERGAAARCGMHFESFRKILRGTTSRPRDATLRKLSDGLDIPMRKLAEARAQDAGEAVVEDITTQEALEIAIARVGDVPEEELPAVRTRTEQLLRRMQDEHSG